MKKAWMSGCLAAVLALSLGISALAAGIGGFQLNQLDKSFSDVKTEQWFSPWVHEAVRYGLLKGKSDTAFCPDEGITLAELVVLAARLRNTYYGGSEADFEAQPGENWYQPYVDYCSGRAAFIDSDVIPRIRKGHADDPANRAETAYFLAQALPTEAYTPQNTVAVIPDIAEDDWSGFEVYRLYRAGITQGKDAAGTFDPFAGILRSEVAAMLVRLVDPDRRLSFTLKELPMVSGRYYEQNNANAPGNWIEFNAAERTFTINVNLYEGYGQVVGSYTASGTAQSGAIYCTVEGRNFQGWLGDDVMGINLRVESGRITVLAIYAPSQPDGSGILCSIWPGAVFAA